MKHIILASLILTGCGSEPEAVHDDVVAPETNDSSAADKTETLVQPTLAATENEEVAEECLDEPVETPTPDAAVPTPSPTPVPTPSPTPEPVDPSVWIDEQSGALPQYMKKWKYGGIGWRDQGPELCGDWHHAGSFEIREAMGHGLLDYFQPSDEPARAWASDWQWHTTGDRRGEEVLIAEGFWNLDVPLHIFCWKERQ